VRLKGLVISTTDSHPSCDSATIKDVDEVVLVAHEAYKSGVWSKASRQARADVLDKIADGLTANLSSLIPLEVEQTGRAIREMNAQVPSLVKWFKYYSSVLRIEERPVLPTMGKLHNWVDRVPIGVVAQITPLCVLESIRFEY
jgi:acyl-CoA reductase-like NAD-dependent aldehyde dehydrogenase